MNIRSMLHHNTLHPTICSKHIPSSLSCFLLTARIPVLRRLDSLLSKQQRTVRTTTSKFRRILFDSIRQPHHTQQQHQQQLYRSTHTNDNYFCSGGCSRSSCCRNSCCRCGNHSTIIKYHHHTRVASSQPPRQQSVSPLSHWSFMAAATTTSRSTFIASSSYFSTTTGSKFNEQNEKGDDPIRSEKKTKKKATTTKTKKVKEKHIHDKNNFTDIDDADNKVDDSMNDDTDNTDNNNSSNISSLSSAIIKKERKQRLSSSTTATLDISKYRGWDTLDFNDNNDENNENGKIDNKSDVIFSGGSSSSTRSTIDGPIFDTMVTRVPRSEKTTIMRAYDDRINKDVDLATKLHKKLIRRKAQKTNQIFNKRCQTCPSCRKNMGGHSRMIAHLTGSEKCFSKCDEPTQKALGAYIIDRHEVRREKRDNKKLRLLTGHGTRHTKLLQHYIKENLGPVKSWMEVTLKRDPKRMYSLDPGPLRGSEDTDSDSDDGDVGDDDDTNLANDSVSTDTNNSVSEPDMHKHDRIGTTTTDDTKLQQQLMTKSEQLIE